MLGFQFSLCVANLFLLVRNLSAPLLSPPSFMRSGVHTLFDGVGITATGPTTITFTSAFAIGTIPLAAVI